MCFDQSLLQLSKIQKSLAKASGWIIDSVIDHTINISKIKCLSWKQLHKITKRITKRLINIQNMDDNKCFKRCLVKYLNPADRNPARITKTDKNFAKKLYFKDIKFPVKVRDIHKIKKKNSIDISAFGYENKEKHSI